MARRLMSLCVAGVSTCSNPHRRARGSARACDYTRQKKPTAVFTLLNRLLAAKKKTSLSLVSLLTFCYHMLTDTHR